MCACCCPGRCNRLRMLEQWRCLLPSLLLPVRAAPAQRHGACGHPRHHALTVVLQGTCLVRLGQEVGGVIVSLRPDKALLPGECLRLLAGRGALRPSLQGQGPRAPHAPYMPVRSAPSSRLSSPTSPTCSTAHTCFPPPCPRPAVEERTVESYYSSVSAAQLVGAAHVLEAQRWLLDRLKGREGSVVHVYVPNSSLRQHKGLWVSAAVTGSWGAGPAPASGARRGRVATGPVTCPCLPRSHSFTGLPATHAPHQVSFGRLHRCGGALLTSLQAAHPGGMRRRRRGASYRRRPCHALRAAARRLPRCRRRGRQRWRQQHAGGAGRTGGWLPCRGRRRPAAAGAGSRAGCSAGRTAARAATLPLPAVLRP